MPENNEVVAKVAPSEAQETSTRQIFGNKGVSDKHAPLGA
jgi:hypothetical protein